MKKIITFFIVIISFLFSSELNSQWQVQASVNYPIQDVFFINNFTGWAVGSNKILNTNNGGANWNVQFTGTFTMYTVTFIDQFTGWAVSGNWYPSPASIVYKTTNGGISWSSTNIPNLELVTICFPNNLTGWIAGGYNRPSGVLKTTDGGIAWFTQISNIRVLDLFFLDINTGWQAGDASMKTTNGGLNWDIIQNGTSNYLRTVYFNNNNTGWGVSGHSLDKTTNAGINWFNLYYNNNVYFSDLGFVNNNTFWAVGGLYPDGIVLKTTNSGINWIQQYCSSNNNDGYKNSVFCYDSNKVWIGGGENTHGVIYSTTNGGVTIGIQPVKSSIPLKFALNQNYPNPFNPQTKIGFDISETGKTKIVVFDVYGKEISVLLDEALTPGSYEVIFNGENLASSVYFYSIMTKDFSETKKMILLK